MSTKRDHIEQKFNNRIKRSYQDWQLPSLDENWEKIKSTLDEDTEAQQDLHWNPSLENKVWARINESLQEEQTDIALRSAYEKWDAGDTVPLFGRIEKSMEVNEPLVYTKQLVILFLLLLLTFNTKDQWIVSVANKIQANANTSIEASVPSIPAGQTETPAIRKSGLTKQVRDKLIVSDLTPNEPVEAQAEINQQNEKYIFEVENLAIKESGRLDLVNFPALQNRIPTFAKRPMQNLSWGVILSNTTNLLSKTSENPLTSRQMRFGYEFSLFLSHRLGKLNQQYALSFLEMHQGENEYKNGKFLRSELRVSGIKLNSYCLYPLTKNISVGGGASLFYPLSSVIERKEKIVSFPKMSVFNIGLNFGLDYHLPMQLFTHGLSLTSKYEYLMPLAKNHSSFKHFQNFSLGVKMNW